MSWPSAWEALGDHESVIIPCYTQDWSSSSAELREEQLEESQEDSFRRALVDLERLRVITWLPEASWIETARKHVQAIVIDLAQPVLELD